MKLNYTLRCPECNFVINISISSPTRAGYSYYVCTQCGKKIKFNLDQDTGPTDTRELKASKVSHLRLLEQTHTKHPLDRPAKPTSSQAQRTDKPTEKFESDEEIKVEVTPIKPNESSEPSVTSAPSSTSTTSSTSSTSVGGVKTISKSQKRPKFLSDPRNRLRLASVLLILVFLFGILHGINTMILGTTEFISIDEPKPETSDISGSVRDNQTGRPIKNCKVRILETGQSTVTNSDGQYFIANVKAGVHRIRAEADGYIILNKEVTIDPELMGVINFELDEGVGSKTVDESIELIGSQEKDDMNVFAILIIIFASLAIVSSLLVYRQLFFHISIVTSFISILSIGFGVGIVLGIFAFILISLSASSFGTTSGKTTKLETTT